MNVFELRQRLVDDYADYTSIIRYRPEQVAKPADQKWFFLFSTWLPRATENYLLALTSRVLHEGVRIQ